MAWIESHQELREHPKTKRFARELNITIPHAVGLLHCLWWWAVDYAPDGDLTKYDADDLGDAAGWDGTGESFLAALTGARFVDEDPMRIHSWDEYTGRLMYSRAANAERKRLSRARHADAARPSQARHGATQHNTTQHNHRESNDSLVADAPREKPIALPKKTVVTEEWLAEEREFFGTRLADFDGAVAFAMNTSYFAKKPDKRAYVHGQLENAAKRDAERITNGRTTTPQRNPAGSHSAWTESDAEQVKRYIAATKSRQ